MSDEIPPSFANSCPSENTQSASDNKPDETNPNKAPINVLIIGETAQGKSTLIRQLGVYGGSPGIRVGIGFGNVSCTKEVGHYSVSTSLHEYYLKDGHTHNEIKNIRSLQFANRNAYANEYADRVEYDDADAILEQRIEDDTGKTLTFQLIDTPGLDDSDGNDIEIMADIIGHVSQLTHLNAVIYVRNLTKQFGKSFMDLFIYMQKCMPSLCDGLVIAHTGFSVKEISDALESGRDLVDERRDAFKLATRQSLNLTHVFMDNNPNPEKPFAMMESLNSCYELLKLLSTQLPMNIRTLKLYKTPNMLNKDVHVQLALEKRHGRLKERWNAEVSKSHLDKQLALRTRMELRRERNKFNTIESRLAELDSEDQVLLGTKQVTESFGFKTAIQFRSTVKPKVMEFTSDYQISTVTTSTRAGSKWINEELRGNHWRAEIFAGIWKDFEGSATFYTTSQFKHASEIKTLKENMRDLKESIGFHEDSLKIGADVNEDGNESTTVQLGEETARCAETLRRVSAETFDINLWSRLAIFYKSLDSPTTGDIIEYVRVYDEQTAELLYMQ